MSKNPIPNPALLHGAWTVILLALSGCATSADNLAPARYDRPWTPVTSATGEIQTTPVGTLATATPGAVPGYVLPANTTLARLPDTAAVDPHHPFTLADLIDLAQSSNPATRIAWNEARQAALAAGIVHSSYDPKIGLSVVGGYRTSRGSVSALDQEAQANTDGGGGVAAVSLEWLMFDFGVRKGAIEAARQDVIVADIAFTAAHQRVTHAVTSAFYADTAARAHVKNARIAVGLASDLATAAQDRFKHGIGNVVDVAQAGQASAQAELLMVQAEGAASDARLTLLTAIGISPFARIEVADISNRTLTTDMAEPAEQAVAEALSRRPDMLAALASRKASLARVDSAKAEFMPKVFTSASAAYSRGDLGLSAIPSIGEQVPTLNLSGHQSSATVLVGVSIPLFDGGVRAARLEQAEAGADSAGATIERTRDQAILEIVVAENALRTSLAAYRASQTLLNATHISFDAAFGAYRSGVGSITDVNLAQQQLLVAGNAASDAYSAALSAAATLAFASGTLGAAIQ